MIDPVDLIWVQACPVQPDLLAGASFHERHVQAAEAGLFPIEFFMQISAQVGVETIFKCQTISQQALGAILPAFDHRKSLR